MVGGGDTLHPLKQLKRQSPVSNPCKSDTLSHSIVFFSPIISSSYLHKHLVAQAG